MRHPTAKGDRSRGWCWMLGVWLTAVAGCGSGSDRIEVFGTVTYQGQPVEEGTILLEPLERGGRQANAAIEQGRYRIDGPYGPNRGRYRVIIEALRVTANPVELGPLHRGEPAAEELEQFIPAEYNTQSKLVVDFTGASTHEQNFELP